MLLKELSLFAMSNGQTVVDASAGPSHCSNLLVFANERIFFRSLRKNTYANSRGEIIKKVVETVIFSPDQEFTTSK